MLADGNISEEREIRRKKLRQKKENIDKGTVKKRVKKCTSFLHKTITKSIHDICNFVVHAV